MADPREAEPWKNWTCWVLFQEQYFTIFFMFPCFTWSLLYSLQKIETEVGHRRWRVARAGWCTGHARSRETDWPVLASKCEDVKPFRCWCSFYDLPHARHIVCFLWRAIGPWCFIHSGWLCQSKKSSTWTFQLSGIDGTIGPICWYSGDVLFFTLHPSPRAIFSWQWHALQVVLWPQCVQCLDMQTKQNVPACLFAIFSKWFCACDTKELHMSPWCLSQHKFQNDKFDIWNIPNCASLHHPRF